MRTEKHELVHVWGSDQLKCVICNRIWDKDDEEPACEPAPPTASLYMPEYKRKLRRIAKKYGFPR